MPTVNEVAFRQGAGNVILLQFGACRTLNFFHLSIIPVFLVLASCRAQTADSSPVAEAPFELSNELETCSPATEIIASLPTVNEVFTALLEENRGLAANALLHENLSASLPEEQHLSLLRMMETAQREFVVYREQNPVVGGLGGSASTGFTGAEFGGAGHHLFVGLLALIPAYQLAGFDGEVLRLHEELTSLIDNYEKVRNCEQNSRPRTFGCRGDWRRTDYDSIEIVSPRTARETLHETLYSSGAWNLLDDEGIAPSTKSIKPRSPTLCAHLYRGDRPDSVFEGLKGCQSTPIAALRANRPGFAERYSRREWSKAIEAARLIEKPDYDAAIAYSNLIYQSSGDVEPLKQTMRMAFNDEGQRINVGDAQNNYRAVSIAASCARLSSKRLCEEVGQEIFSQNVACAQRNKDGSPLHQSACDHAVRDLHPANMVRQGYDLGAVLSAIESKPTNQISLLDELSKSKPFVSALASACAHGIRDKDRADEFSALVRVMAHQMLSIRAIADENYSKADLHLRIAFSSLDELSDRRRLIPVILYEYGSSAKDYNAAVMILLLSKLKFVDENARP